MFSSIAWPTWGELFHGDVTFKQVGEIISSMFSELLGHENFADIGAVISSLTEKLALPTFAVLAVLSLIFALRGRKLMPHAKFIGFFFVGFIFWSSLRRASLIRCIHSSYTAPHCRRCDRICGGTSLKAALSRVVHSILCLFVVHDLHGRSASSREHSRIYKR